MEDRNLRDIRNATVGIAELLLGHYAHHVAEECGRLASFTMVQGNFLEKTLGSAAIAIPGMVCEAAAFMLFIKGTYDIGKCVFYSAKDFYQRLPSLRS